MLKKSKNIKIIIKINMKTKLVNYVNKKMILAKLYRKNKYKLIRKTN